MTQEEALIWFKKTAKPEIESYHGVYGTWYYVYEDEDNEFSFTIGYQPYSCGMILEDNETCYDCPHFTSHGDCGEYHLHINDDGTIYYEGSDKTYNENEFNELIGEFL